MSVEGSERAEQASAGTGTPDAMNPDTKKIGRAELILKRRETVAQLRLRGLSIREITAALAEPEAKGGIHDQNDKPFSRAAVHSDLKALRKEWQENSAEAIELHKARQLAEIQAAKRQCWATLDMDALHKFMLAEMKLLGSGAPEKIAGPDNGPIPFSVTTDDIVKAKAQARQFEQNYQGEANADGA